ncbi:MAG: 2-phospho-L-lactate guanylyltransferase [candidate division WS2 bacterium]|uniref:2-phospho-L-lactate guanylyltransferase n=1 Tax=Psychracetigena formicireducens TaxID=2986056 RepID=A0A9E2BFP2_PSYF1|nr:2-phospho-L-lactate guanylyltransferase [Candidatus Psychracetigena formicireducens]MBT9144753.1 2-phospho-L-lactate guanylyltransferase [Candidatus Psychracetigena formicireducens]MBT9150220.1 2-phospho-L-lactate guanylyltransferase [Candidatus Psychracetigena formicireducens]
MDAIVLGGSKEAYWAKEGVDNKTLLKIGSQTVIEKILTILKELKEVNFNRVILTGDSTLPINIRNMADLFITGNEIWEKIEAVMKVTDSEEFMIISGDIPLLSKYILEEVLSLYKAHHPDILLFVVSKDLVEKKFPRFKKSYFFLDGQECKNGNLIFFNRNSYNEMSKLIIPLIKSRKALLPISYLKIGGPKITYKYLLKTLTIKDVEDRIQQLTNLNCQVLFFQHPEIALDIDREKDLVAVREISDFS